jgi:lipoprotein-anchoring transpeptidase ErfK/SrfK
MPSDLVTLSPARAPARIDRRRILTLGLAMAAPALLGACQSSRAELERETLLERRRRDDNPFWPEDIYAAVPGEPFEVPEVDISEIHPRYLRRLVDYDGPERPGAIVVDSLRRHLFLVEPGGKAVRYGVGVGRDDATWRGRATIQRKGEWPGWTPTPSMIRRDPERNGPWAGGMPGGPENPLGARALYLYANGRDTLYRIHGTNEPWSIGQNVSSGCIRLINQDIIDLHARVPVGTTVNVLS